MKQCYMVSKSFKSFTRLKVIVCHKILTSNKLFAKSTNQSTRQLEINNQQMKMGVESKSNSINVKDCMQLISNLNMAILLMLSDFKETR